MSRDNKILIQGALLALEGRLVPGDLLIRGGLIAEIRIGESIAPLGDGETVSGKGHILAPGFIDLHCHGGAGGDVSDGEREAFFKAAEFHLRHGVTSFMPAVPAVPMGVLQKAVSMLRAVREEENPACPEILGLHFESPYINPLYKGCMAEECILPFNGEAMNFIAENRDIIARITVAPEIEGVMEAIPRLREMGIIVSGGHSNAGAAIAREAADRGMTMATHLYNAMAAVRKEGPFRVPAILEAVLTDDRIYTECIADGYHVPPELLQIAYRCKGPDKFMICSDASKAAGYAGTEPLFICGHELLIENGVIMTKDRSGLASSAAALDAMVRVLTIKAGFQIVGALRAASYVPAMAAGVADRKGRIAPGYDADLVLLDTELKVKGVWRLGRQVSI